MAEEQRNRVYLEVGAKKVFACSVDWPGWARSGRSDVQALATLSSYAARYAPVAERAGMAFPDPLDSTHVVERVDGSGATDFGVPHAVPDVDAEAVDKDEAERLAALVAASWAYLDQVVAQAPPTLRKGPRGGGRDRDAIAQHVVGAEASYARSIGVRHKEPDAADKAAVAALRRDIGAVLSQPWSGEQLARKRWPPRYAARRIAWHVLDHAWEIEDKST